MKNFLKMIWLAAWIPFILLAGIISNRAPLGEGVNGGTPWIKWLPWGHKRKR